MSWTVADVMTESVTTVRPDTPFKAVVEMIWTDGVSALPVVDEGRVVGIISEADCLLKEEHGPAERRRAWQAGGAPLWSRGAGADAAFLHELARAAGRTAEDLMTSPVITTQPDASLETAARLLHRSGVKRLVVVGRMGELRGIVTRSDLLKVFLRSDHAIRADVAEGVARSLPDAAASISVGVTDGVVSLTGEVPTRDLADLAETAALEVPGVVEVDNDLVYREPAAAAPVAGD